MEILLGISIRNFRFCSQVSCTTIDQNPRNLKINRKFKYLNNISRKSQFLKFSMILTLIRSRILVLGHQIKFHWVLLTRIKISLVYRGRYFFAWLMLFLLEVFSRVSMRFITRHRVVGAKFLYPFSCTKFLYSSFLFYSIEERWKYPGIICKNFQYYDQINF